MSDVPEREPERQAIKLSRWWIAPVVFGVGLGVAATMMRSSGDDEQPRAEPVTASLAPASTLDPLAVTVAVEITAVGLDPDFLAGIVDDDAVTADELAGAYGAYVDCLAANGGEGFYAFDVELRSGLNVEWQLTRDGRATGDIRGIEAACSASFLGDLQARFDAATPLPDDLAARQRQSVVACIEPLSPEAAAEFPAELSVNTLVTLPTLDELQQAPDLFGVAPELLDPISRCISAAGADWHAFGA